MPCCCGKSRRRVYMEGLDPVKYYKEHVISKLQEMFDLLLLEEKEAALLFRLYTEIDTDGSGSISRQEFYEFFSIDATKFVDRIFSYFDLDKSNTLDFQEFLVGIWNFCTFDDYRMADFAVSIFDVDKSGSLDKFECDALIRMVHQIPEVGDDMIYKLKELDDNGDGAITTEELSKNSAELLKPALNVRNHLRKRTISTAFWEEMTEKRTKTFGEKASTEDVLLRNRKKIRRKLLGSKKSHSQIDTEENHDIPENKGNNKVHEESENEREYEDETNVNKTETEKEERLLRISIQGMIQAYQETEPEDIFKKAELKQSLQENVHKLLDLVEKAGLEKERIKYRNTIISVEEDAAKFFEDKEGKKFLKIVGKEHALRKHNPRFNIVSKRQQREGEVKAKNDYIAKKMKEASREVQAELKEEAIERKHDLVKILKDQNLLSPEEEAIIAWQWQKLYDQKTCYNYYFCPALELTLWEEPNLLNSEGNCQDKTCDQDAVLRCDHCQLELCTHCDVVAHSIGNARFHSKREQIPQEEVQWRQEAKVHFKKHRDLLTKYICTDPIELERRNVINYKEPFS